MNDLNSDPDTLAPNITPARPETVKSTTDLRGIEPALAAMRGGERTLATVKASLGNRDNNAHQPRAAETSGGEAPTPPDPGAGGAGIGGGHTGPPQSAAADEPDERPQWTGQDQVALSPPDEPPPTLAIPATAITEPDTDVVDYLVRECRQHLRSYTARTGHHPASGGPLDAERLWEELTAIATEFQHHGDAQQAEESFTTAVTGMRAAAYIAGQVNRAPDNRQTPIPPELRQPPPEQLVKPVVAYARDAAHADRRYLTGTELEPGYFTEPAQQLTPDLSMEQARRIGHEYAASWALPDVSLSADPTPARKLAARELAGDPSIHPVTDDHQEKIPLNPVGELAGKWGTAHYVGYLEGVLTQRSMALRFQTQLTRRTGRYEDAARFSIAEDCIAQAQTDLAQATIDGVTAPDQLAQIVSHAIAAIAERSADSDRIRELMATHALIGLIETSPTEVANDSTVAALVPAADNAIEALRVGLPLITTSIESQPRSAVTYDLYKATARQADNLANAFALLPQNSPAHWFAEHMARDLASTLDPRMFFQNQARLSEDKFRDLLREDASDIPVWTQQKRLRDPLLDRFQRHLAELTVHPDEPAAAISAANTAKGWRHDISNDGERTAVVQQGIRLLRTNLARLDYTVHHNYSPAVFDASVEQLNTLLVAWRDDLLPTLPDPDHEEAAYLVDRIGIHLASFDEGRHEIRSSPELAPAQHRATMPTDELEWATAALEAAALGWAMPTDTPITRDPVEVAHQAEWAVASESLPLLSGRLTQQLRDATNTTTAQVILEETTQTSRREYEVRAGRVLVRFSPEEFDGLTPGQRALVEKTAHRVESTLDKHRDRQNGTVLNGPAVLAAASNRANTGRLGVIALRIEPGPGTKLNKAQRNEAFRRAVTQIENRAGAAGALAALVGPSGRQQYRDIVVAIPGGDDAQCGELVATLTEEFDEEQLAATTNISAYFNLGNGHVDENGRSPLERLQTLGGEPPLAKFGANLTDATVPPWSPAPVAPIPAPAPPTQQIEVAPQVAAELGIQQHGWAVRRSTWYRAKRGPAGATTPNIGELSFHIDRTDPDPIATVRASFAEFLTLFSEHTINVRAGEPGQLLESERIANYCMDLMDSGGAVAEIMPQLMDHFDELRMTMRREAQPTLWSAEQTALNPEQAVAEFGAAALALHRAPRPQLGESHAQWLAARLGAAQPLLTRGVELLRSMADGSAGSADRLADIAANISNLNEIINLDWLITGAVTTAADLSEQQRGQTLDELNGLMQAARRYALEYRNTVNPPVAAEQDSSATGRHLARPTRRPGPVITSRTRTFHRRNDTALDAFAPRQLDQHPTLLRGILPEPLSKQAATLFTPTAAARATNADEVTRRYLDRLATHKQRGHADYVAAQRLGQARQVIVVANQLPFFLRATQPTEPAEPDQQRKDRAATARFIADLAGAQDGPHFFVHLHEDCLTNASNADLEWLEKFAQHPLVHDSIVIGEQLPDEVLVTLPKEARQGRQHYQWTNSTAAAANFIEQGLEAELQQHDVLRLAQDPHAADQRGLTERIAAERARRNRGRGRT